MSSVELSVVVPCYTEAGNLPELVARLLSVFEKRKVRGELVLVNDGSADRTSEVVRALMPSVTVPIILVEHARNFGEHNAVLTGWRHGVIALLGTGYAPASLVANVVHGALYLSLIHISEPTRPY